ncbi:COMPASS component Swd2p [Trichomonascus vanleenenianus]|uniref:WD-repeat containing protein SWD2 n=1 Tax=Trichomonascus vanleenenianus TaxID=2268995 RepID=UPI003ECB83D8
MADGMLSRLRPSKTFKYSSDKVDPELTSIDFDDRGEYCITSSAPERQMYLYDARSGVHKRPIASFKYGCNYARFTHSSTNCLHSSTLEDDTIRYLSLHDIKYLQYFKGHKDKVIGLEMSPADDTFLSSSLDHSIRLWDLRMPYAIGVLYIPAPNLIAYDPAGVVFAVASQEMGSISLFSRKDFQSQPFLTFDVSINKSRWLKLEFTNNGSHILLSTEGPTHLLFDAFNGNLVKQLAGFTPIDPRSRTYPPQPTSISVDGKYVVGGSGDGRLCIWDISKALEDEKEKQIRPTSIPSSNVAAVAMFNPKYMMLATGDRELTFWLPEQDDV